MCWPLETNRDWKVFPGGRPPATRRRPHAAGDFPLSQQISAVVERELYGEFADPAEFAENGD
jgi:hypothetical protein